MAPQSTCISLSSSLISLMLFPTLNHYEIVILSFASDFSKLPSWIKAFVPRFFYVTEKAWNFYPFTITEYSVSFVPRFSICIETRFENNNGSNDNVFGDMPTPADDVCFLDILTDPNLERHYNESEVRNFTFLNKTKINKMK
ncbi:Cytoplasmic phosphatidylinositol transfer protein 1 [Characodon lateralis]|uniref:Cytoplasmic phosphatidylinositol transfer protein 1 n=1 Tax=Characodon lateralis TaxID=208331 RepID=A0ABU7F2L3_9TELE|nr:Cytoplasmic phosphatidylinositol transfer protein 1 [Characodon lateralis]